MTLLLRKPIALLLLAATQLTFSAQAQTVNSMPKRLLDPKFATSRAAYELFQKHHAGAAQKTTGTSERIIGIYQLQYKSNGTVNQEDSSWYCYSGARGNNPKGGSMYMGNMRMDMLFDTGVHYVWTGTQGAYKLSNRVLKSFNAQDRPDSFVYQDWNGSFFQNQQKGTYVYYSSGKESQTDNFEWDMLTKAWRPSYRNLYTYNSAGDILSDTFQSWDNATNAMFDVNRELYAYDAAGRLITMIWQTFDGSTSSWEINSKDSIGYSSTGKVSSWTTWHYDNTSGKVDAYRDLTYYNSADFQIAAVSQSYSGGNWNSGDSTVHAVLNAAGLPLVDSVYAITTGWQLVGRNTNTYTSANLLSTSLIEQFLAGSFSNYSRDFYFYDSYNQLTRYYDQYWKNSAWSNSYAGEQRFYYEPYTTVGIHTAASAAAIQGYLYPVPTGNKATLALNLQAQQKLRISLYDAAGKLQYSWNEEARAGLYTKDFSVEVLPAGTYSLLVDAGNGHWSGMLTVVH